MTCFATHNSMDFWEPYMFCFDAVMRHWHHWQNFYLWEVHKKRLAISSSKGVCRYAPKMDQNGMLIIGNMIGYNIPVVPHKAVAENSNNNNYNYNNNNYYYYNHTTTTATTTTTTTTATTTTTTTKQLQLQLYDCNYTTLITLHHNYNSTTLQLQLQLQYITLHPAVSE